MIETTTGSPETDESTRFVDIVDDDRSVQKALGRLLNSVGLRSRAYTSASEFLQCADLETSACLLLDIHLPGHGIQLMKHLREIVPDLPVICMTGRDNPNLRYRVDAAGAHGCLRKPFDEVELFKAISLATRIPIPRPAPKNTSRGGEAPRQEPSG